jgi:filamentous hemagglutinin
MKGGNIYINEVKPLNTDNSIMLASDSASLPTQMSDDWILHAANRLKETKDSVLQNTARIVLDAIELGNIVKVVPGVNSKGVTAVKFN